MLTFNKEEPISVFKEETTKRVGEYMLSQQNNRGPIMLTTDYFFVWYASISKTKEISTTVSTHKYAYVMLPDSTAK